MTERGLELYLRCLCLEKRLLHWDKLDSTLKLLLFCCYRSISAQLSRFLAIFLANLRLAVPDNRMQTITRSARTDIIMAHVSGFQSRLRSL